MIFIAILIALVLERFFDWSHLRRWQWFDAYCQKISMLTEKMHPYARAAACLLPPALLALVIGLALSGKLFGILQLFFNIAILLYCFGPSNFWKQLYDCLQAMQKGDPQLIDARVREAFPQTIVSNSQSLHPSLVRNIFIEGHRRIFAPVFWFGVLGPFGGMLYRQTVLAHSKAPADIAKNCAKCIEILDWLPARLLGFLFALGGHFVKVFQQWKKYAPQGLDTSDAIISETGMAALDFSSNKVFPEQGDAEKAAVELFDRVLIIMLVFLALVVLISS